MKKEIRQRFKQEVFSRDGFKCVFCEKDAVDAHHITDRSEIVNGGYVKDNGISLCSYHHRLAEKYHESCGKSWEDGFHPDDLYRKIGSSKEIAIQRSK
jgi:hypothetical protein